MRGGPKLRAVSSRHFHLQLWGHLAHDQRMWIVFRPVPPCYLPIAFLMGLGLVERLGRGAGSRDEAREPVHRLLGRRPLGVEVAQEGLHVVLALDHVHGLDGVRRGHPLGEEPPVARVRVDERVARHGDPAAGHGDRDLAGRDLRIAVPELRPEILHVVPSCGTARGLATPWLNAP